MRLLISKWKNKCNATIASSSGSFNLLLPFYLSIHFLNQLKFCAGSRELVLIPTRPQQDAGNTWKSYQDVQAFNYISSHTKHLFNNHCMLRFFILCAMILEEKKWKNVVWVIFVVIKHRFYTLTDLKCVFGDTRQAVIHGASSPRVDHYLSYFICLAQLRRPVWFYNAHQSWNTHTGHNINIKYV